MKSCHVCDVVGVKVNIQRGLGAISQRRALTQDFSSLTTLRTCRNGNYSTKGLVVKNLEKGRVIASRKLPLSIMAIRLFELKRFPLGCSTSNTP
jgi:hypothetical protein